jgi:hypothetical protein
MTLRSPAFCAGSAVPEFCLRVPAPWEARVRATSPLRLEPRFLRVASSVSPRVPCWSDAARSDRRV